MATAARPARKANYTAIGQAGRKTGITVEDTGERNEDGFEKMDVFFSPTTAGGRTPARNGFDDEDEDESVYASGRGGTSQLTMASASMDLQSSSTALDPPAALAMRNGSPARQYSRAGSIPRSGAFDPPRRPSVGPGSSPQRLAPNRYSADPFARERSRSASPPKRPDPSRGKSPFGDVPAPYARKSYLPSPRKDNPLFSGSSQHRHTLQSTREEPEPETAPTLSAHATPQNSPPRKKAPPRLPTSEIPSSPQTPKPAASKPKPKPGKLLSLGTRPAPPSSPPQSEPEIVPEDNGDDYELTPRLNKSLKKSALPPPKVPKVKKVVEPVPVDSDEDDLPPPPPPQKKGKAPAREPSPALSELSDLEESLDIVASTKPSKTNGVKAKKSSSKPKDDDEVEGSGSEAETSPQSGKASQKKSAQDKGSKGQSRRGKSAPKPHKAPSPDISSEDEAPVKQTQKKGAASKKSQKAPVVEEISDEEEEPAVLPKKTTSKKSQRKPEAFEDEEPEAAPKKTGTKKNTVQKEAEEEEEELPSSSQRKSTGRKKAVAEEVSEETSEAQIGSQKRTASKSAKTKSKQKEIVTIEDSPEAEPEAEPEPEPERAPQRKTTSKKAGPSSKKAPVVQEPLEESEPEPDPEPAQPPSKSTARKSKAASKKAEQLPSSSSSGSKGTKRSREEDDMNPSSEISGTPAKKAAASKASKSTTKEPAKGKRKVPDEEEEIVEAAEEATATSEGDQSAARRSPKRRKTTAKPKTKRAPAAVDDASDEAVPSTQIVRKEKPQPAEIPQEDLGKRRSHRARVQPVAFWRGEKVVYKLGERRASISAVAMPVMQEVVRVEEPPQKPKRKPAASRSTSSKKAAKKKAEESEEEWDQDDLEDWEKEDGVFEGMIRMYPPNEDDPDMMISEELAITAERIQPQWVPNGNFALCKTVSKDFLGSGIIDLPPGGEKRTKNSGKMHIIMYVVNGQLEVRIGENIFRMRKGGQFSIPRGNLYSLVNHWDRPVRLFFVQGKDTAVSGKDNSS